MERSIEIGFTLPDDFAPFGWMFVPGGGAGGIYGGGPGIHSRNLYIYICIYR